MSEYRESFKAREAERRTAAGLPEPCTMWAPQLAFKAPLRVAALGGDIYCPTQLCGFLESGHRIFVKHQAARGGGVYVTLHDWEEENPDAFFYFRDLEDHNWTYTTWEELRPLLASIGVECPETLDPSLTDDLCWCGH